MAARSQLDLDRLARLAAWTRTEGEPIDLHWLLTGESAMTGFPGPAANWLTPARIRALEVLAESVPSLPKHSPKPRASPSHGPRSGVRATRRSR